MADLEQIDPKTVPFLFVSTVTGGVLPGLRLGAGYWWDNIRQPVQFVTGIRAVANLGARFFVEIGPTQHAAQAHRGRLGGRS